MTRNLRMLTAGLALALLPLTASPAHAAESTYQGDCGFITVSQDTLTGNEYVGYLDAQVVLYSGDHGNVVNATVTCEVRVNGVTRTSASRWGSGAVVFVAPARFAADDVDTVAMCTVVDFTSDDTPTRRDCAQSTRTEAPPQELADLFSVVFDWVNYVFMAYVDPVACDTLGLLAPGVEPLTVNEQGDIYLAGELFWNCPPYEDGTTPPQPESPPALPAPPSAPGLSGAGYNTGDAGVLLLREGTDVVSACAYAKDPTTGTIEVIGSTATTGANAASVRCRLTDTATGAELYDGTASANAPLASLRDTVAAHTGPVTVCTEGTGVWADREVTVGPHCRPGEPVDRLVA